jgi:diaminopimelate epimerase
MEILKAHAYGNDFLFAAEPETRGRDLPLLAKTLCARHTGIGADGLIVFRPTPAGAAMTLFNADGSCAEVSGNGVRCLAAIVARGRGIRAGTDVRHVDPVIVDTDAGPKILELLEVDQGGYVFRASMGHPTGLRQLDVDAAGACLRVVALSVGNPQCVVLGPPVDETRMRQYGPVLERHPAFPGGTNVEFVEVETPGRVRMLIWERGVGPTAASGTGACAAAVAAGAFGGASRDVDVVAPGGTQRVEWRDDGLFLTGRAEIVVRGEWLG